MDTSSYKWEWFYLSSNMQVLAKVSKGIQTIRPRTSNPWAVGSTPTERTSKFMMIDAFCTNHFSQTHAGILETVGYWC